MTPFRCCLRFGSPVNEFIFDGIIDRLWEVAQGRFGARSIRACLENECVTLSQQVCLLFAGEGLS